jgi:hypothetical protein
MESVSLLAMLRSGVASYEALLDVRACELADGPESEALRQIASALYFAERYLWQLFPKSQEVANIATAKILAESVELESEVNIGFTVATLKNAAACVVSVSPDIAHRIRGIASSLLEDPPGTAGEESEATSWKSVGQLRNVETDVREFVDVYQDLTPLQKARLQAVMHDISRLLIERVGTADFAWAERDEADNNDDDEAE